MIRNQKNIEQPSSAMFFTIFVLWIGLNTCFANRYLSLVVSQCGVLTKAVALMIVSWLILTTFYACFHIVSFVFSFILSINPQRVLPTLSNVPPVAIFYTCMNDMNSTSVKGCLSQDYHDFTVYILDDSTAAEELERIDALKREYGGKLKIVRRTIRKGFKAGNLNNSLKFCGRC